MKVTVLCDNNTLIDRYFVGEPGLSLYIEDEGATILYDCGYSKVFIDNAQKMGIDLLNVDYIVFSHGHLDHTWGFLNLVQLYTEAVLEKKPHKKPTIIAHPHVFLSRYDTELAEAGSLISQERAASLFQLQLSKQEQWITKRLVFLGQIQGKRKGMNMVTTLRTEPEQPDNILDDSALAFKGKEGTVVLSGCSHSGITNIVEAAKKLTGVSNTRDVIGGFHTLDYTEEERKELALYFKENAIKDCHPCHCTDLRAKCALSSVCNVHEVGVGLSLEYQ